MNQYLHDDDCAEFLSGAQFQIPYKEKKDDEHACQKCVVAIDALRQAWLIFDTLGMHQSDDERLAILHGPAFSSAAYKVRCAMRLIGDAI